jgi:ribosomal protein L20A (L18A)
MQMVKEFRALSRAEAVESMYQDMAARHRARFRNVQILRVAEIEKKEDVRRPYIKQLLEPGLKFPLPHRRTTSKAWFAASRPVSISVYAYGTCCCQLRLLMNSLPGLRFTRRDEMGHLLCSLGVMDLCITTNTVVDSTFWPAYGHQAVIATGRLWSPSTPRRSWSTEYACWAWLLARGTQLLQA